MIFQKKIRFIANIALACLEATSTGRCIIIHTHKYYKTQRKHQSLTILDISNKKKTRINKQNTLEQQKLKINVVPNDYNQHTVEIFVV